jgi:transcriptional regulator with XRE-family HTH domain
MADTLADRLGKNVRQLRQARGLTQQQMAKLSELPRATWANIESGAANPTLAVLYRLARALQVPLEELIARGRRDCCQHQTL